MPIQWLQLHFPVCADSADPISAELTEHGALAITLTPTKENPLFQEAPNAMPLTDNMVLSALFSDSTDESLLLAALKTKIPADSLDQVKTEILVEKDWVSETQRQFEPTHIANRLWVVPNWVKETFPSPFLRLDPGLGFGTGSHPTTALCLEWLAGAELKNKTVIDFGCGSGILSLAACALGAKHVYAIDHDEQAITATHHNLSLNPDFSQSCCAGDSSLLPENYQADIIVANILAKPLMTLFDILNKHAKPGTQLILSGPLEKDGPAVIERYQSAFTLVHQEQQGEWIRLNFTKK